MRLTWKDGLGTVLVAAMAVLYGFYVALAGIGPSWLGIQDATGMAVVGLGVGVLVTALGAGIPAAKTQLMRTVHVGLGIVSVVLGVLALFGENLFSAAVWDGVLMAFMGSVVLRWLVFLGERFGFYGGERKPGLPSAQPA